MIVEKLAKCLLETVKTRLNYNASEFETILQLHEDLDDFDKKTINYGRQVKPFTTSRFGAHRSGHIGVGQARKGFMSAGFPAQSVRKSRLTEASFCLLLQKFPRPVIKITPNKKDYTSRYKLMLNDYKAIRHR